MPDPTQATRILAALSGWLSAEPGRSVRLALEGRKWTVRLEEVTTCRGTSLVDAASQAGTVAAHGGTDS